MKLIPFRKLTAPRFAMHMKAGPGHRGFHSSTSQLNLSRLWSLKSSDVSRKKSHVTSNSGQV